MLAQGLKWSIDNSNLENLTMRLISLVSTSLLLVLMRSAPIHAQQLSEEDRYKLCTDAPTTAQCSGYEVPIALDDRPGEAGACVRVVSAIETQTVCKLVVNENKVTAYYEVGEKLPFLKKRRATREIQLNPKEIKAIQYQEGSKGNTTARVINTLLFGISGLFTRNKAVSEIAIDYAAPSSDLPPTPPGATGSTDPQISGSSAVAKAPDSVAAKPIAGSSAAPDSAAAKPTNPQAAASNPTDPIPTTAVTASAPANTDRIKIVVRRKTGESLRRQLEQLTGMQAVTPPAPVRQGDKPSESEPSQSP